jgi:hypothetical protein
MEFLHQGRADSSGAAAGNQGATRHCEIMIRKMEKKKEERGKW